MKKQHMQIIQYFDGYDNFIVICSDLDNLKENLCKIMLNLSNEEPDCGFSSLNDEIMDCVSFDQIADLVYDFACDTGITFRISECSFGEIIKIMN